MVIDPKPKIPLPPHPRERREPLPTATNPARANRDAEARVKAILESSNYRIASEDPDFLASDAARGLRLQMDYLKPELALRAHRVERTIVVLRPTLPLPIQPFSTTATLVIPWTRAR